MQLRGLVKEPLLLGQVVRQGVALVEDRHQLGMTVRLTQKALQLLPRRRVFVLDAGHFAPGLNGALAVVQLLVVDRGDAGKHARLQLGVIRALGGALQDGDQRRPARQQVRQPQHLFVQRTLAVLTFAGLFAPGAAKGAEGGGAVTATAFLQLGDLAEQLDAALAIFDEQKLDFVGAAQLLPLVGAAVDRLYHLSNAEAQRVAAWQAAQQSLQGPRRRAVALVAAQHFFVGIDGARQVAQLAFVQSTQAQLQLDPLGLRGGGVGAARALDAADEQLGQVLPAPKLGVQAVQRQRGLLVVAVKVQDLAIGADRGGLVVKLRFLKSADLKQQGLFAILVQRQVGGFAVDAVQIIPARGPLQHGFLAVKRRHVFVVLHQQASVAVFGLLYFVQLVVVDLGGRAQDIQRGGAFVSGLLVQVALIDRSQVAPVRQRRRQAGQLVAGLDLAGLLAEYLAVPAERGGQVGQLLLVQGGNGAA